MFKTIAKTQPGEKRIRIQLNMNIWRILDKIVAI